MLLTVWYLHCDIYFILTLFGYQFANTDYAILFFLYFILFDVKEYILDIYLPYVEHKWHVILTNVDLSFEFESLLFWFDSG